MAVTGAMKISLGATPLVALATIRALQRIALRLAIAFDGHDHRGGPVAHLRGVAGRHGVRLAERRLAAWPSASSVGIGARPFVGLRRRCRPSRPAP